MNHFEKKPLSGRSLEKDPAAELKLEKNFHLAVTTPKNAGAVA